MTSLKTYSEQITEHIKKMLLDGSLKPGDKVNEVHLASALSISRAPIREALQMLVREDIIVYIPQRGKYIKALTCKEILDSYFIGGVLEGAAVALTCNQFEEADYLKIEAILQEMQALQNGFKPEEFMRLDGAFHNSILHYSGTEMILEHTRSLCERVSKFLLVRHWPLCFSLKESVERHRKVYEMLRTREKLDIELCIREHYFELGKRMAEFGCETPEYH